MRSRLALMVICVAATGALASGQVPPPAAEESAAISPGVVSEPSLTTAADGTGIPHPTSRTTTTVVAGARSIAVPAGMVYIPAGKCRIGDGAGEKTEDVAEFCIGRFPVTNAEYQAFLAATATPAPKYWHDGSYPAGKANHPVAFVSLVRARAYAAWVGRATGREVAIPTAIQWEKAARGPDGTLYPWGNSPDVKYEDGVLTTKFNYNAVLVAPLLKKEPDREVTYSDRKSPHFGTKTTVARIAAIAQDGRSTPLSIAANGSVRAWNSHATATGFTGTDLFKAINADGGNTTPVGTYPAGRSRYGVDDMAGNIWNWTESLIVATNGVEKGKTVNEIRGGSWYSYVRSCRATTIGEGRDAAGNYNTVGFRIVMIPPTDAH